MSELIQEQCEYCDAGWCEGRPEPTPDGPYYPSYRCTMCNGDGWVVIVREPVTEDDVMDMEEALRLDEEKLIAMGAYD